MTAHTNHASALSVLSPQFLQGYPVLPWLRYGVTTQRADLPLSGDMSFSTGRDDPDAVRANRATWLATVGSDLDHAVMPALVHETAVAVVTAADAGRGVRDPATAIPRTDALITDTPGLTLCICYADCVPVLLVDPTRRAIGLGHAGWRGTLAGMATAMVAAMGDAFGSRPDDLQGMVGPSIGPDVYTVGPEVVEAFETGYPTAGLIIRAGDDTRLDLWRANISQLTGAGIPAAQVACAGVCTLTEGARFFSHRYALAHNEREGRFAVMLGIGE